jgi:4-amino-4-deoxy-L-arabinose transferase-like glycosyltransferase
MGEQASAGDERTPWARLSVLLAVSAALRLVWWRLGPQVIEAEGSYYARVAENLAAGRGLIGLREAGLQLLYPPLYPALIAVGVKLGLASEAAGRLVSVIAGSWLPVIVCLLARRIHGAAAGWLAGALTALHPLLIGISAAVLTESTYLTLSMLAILFVVELLARDSRPWALGAGALFGLAYLCRPEALLLAALASMGLVLANLRDWRRAAGRAALLLAVLGLLAAPYVIFLHGQTGQLRFEAKSADGLRKMLREEAGWSEGEIYFKVGDDLVEQGNSNTSDLEQLTTTRIALGHRLRLTLRQGLRNLPRTLRGLGGLQLGQPFLGALVALGVFAVAWDRRRLRAEAPLLAVVGLTLLTFGTWPFFHDRFLFPVLPVLLVWSAAGLSLLGRQAAATARALVPQRRFGASAAAIAMGGAAALLIASAAVGARASDDLSQAWSAHRDDASVGRWLRPLAGQERLRLMDSEPIVAYYAGAVLVPFPWTDAATALRYMARKDLSYVVLRDADTGRRPYLGAWLREPPPQLQLVKTFRGDSGAIRVYRWGGGTPGGRADAELTARPAPAPSR